MSDEEYDRLEKRLKELVKEHPEAAELATVLSKVGSDIKPLAGRIKHSTPMLSLENHYTLDELHGWLSKFPAETCFIVEPKVDGASCSLVYVDRKLVRALTRGDGESGEDVTAQMRASGAIPLELPETFPASKIEIRGEVFISQGQFDKINKTAVKAFASPRNLASGTMKLLDLNEVKKRGLKFFVWQVEGIDEEHLKERNLSKNFSHHLISYVCSACPIFPQPDFSTFTDPKHLVDQIDTKLRIIRDTVWLKGRGINTDGLAIKVADPALRKELGGGSKYPNWACCFKYPAPQVETTLTGVEWFVGRTGNLTPVGLLEPVNVSGAIVSNVNLNNLSWIQGKEIKIGDRVVIQRSGEVIPFLDKVASTTSESKQINAPKTCPECGQDILVAVDPKSNVISHWCTYSSCLGRLSAHLEYIASRDVLEIDGLGPELVKKLIDEELVFSIPDLFAFGNDILANIKKMGEDKIYAGLNKKGFPAASVIKMAKSLDQAKTRDWDRWITALGISGIGRSLAKGIAVSLRLQPDSFPQLPTLLKTSPFSDVDGMGEKRLSDIRSFDFGTMAEELFDHGVRPTALIQEVREGEQPLTGIILCITGEFSLEREVIAKKLTSLGAVVKSGVSKKLTHLLVGDAAGKSKLQKAAELNLPKLHKDWLDKVLNENNMMEEPKMKFDAEWDDL